MMPQDSVYSIVFLLACLFLSRVSLVTLADLELCADQVSLELVEIHLLLIPQC